jgi:hypothetical protein
VRPPPAAHLWAAGLFFGCESAATWASLALRREFGQTSAHFSPPAPNSFPIQAGDPRQFDIARTIRLLREHPDIPASLGLGEPAEKEVHALMLLHDTGISSCLTDCALAQMDSEINRFGHAEPPVWMVSIYHPGEGILLWTLSEEGTPLWPRNVERMFASVVEQAGLAKIYPAPPRPESLAVNDSTGTAKKSKYRPKTCAVCPQDLRRTVLTLLGDLGVDDATKARIAGHGPKNVTMRYDRGALERMRDALQKLEDLILGEEE